VTYVVGSIANFLRLRSKEIFCRLQTRDDQPKEVSDATWEVYLRQRKQVEPCSELPLRCHLIVDTAWDMEILLRKVEDSLRVD
jgi:predicted kinase